MKRNLYSQNRSLRNSTTAVEMATLPWPAKRLAKRHGLRAATAKVVAELLGYALESR